MDEVAEHSTHKKFSFNLIWPIKYLSAHQKTYLWRSIFLSIAYRVGLMIVAYIIARIFQAFQSESIFKQLENVLIHWDAHHYLKIAEVGYQPSGPDKYLMVFFPFYPFLIHLVSYIIPNTILSALSVSFFASVAVGFFLQDLLHLNGWEEEDIFKALLLCFLFPTSFYMILPYTEALFLALSLLAFWSARKENWWLAGIAGALACATRLPGVLLALALSYEAWSQNKNNIKLILKASLPLLLIPSGLVLYLFLNWYILGNPFEFMVFQREHWHQELVMPWTQIKLTFEHMFLDQATVYRVVYYEARMVGIIMGIGLLLLGIKRLPVSYQIFAWSSLLLAMTASFSVSLPRYLWTIFPIFMVLARLCKHNLVFHCVLVVFNLVTPIWLYVYAAGKGGF